jgi:hypothetical protein
LFLQTISKRLEQVVVQRFSEYLEKERKLSLIQFGAWLQYSTEQVLTILVKKVYNTWRRAKVLLLVTFDIQGTYNSINKDVLQQRLQKSRIPEFFVK